MTPERKRLAALLAVLVVLAVFAFWPASSPVAPAVRIAAGGGKPAPARTSTYTAENLPTPVPTVPREEKDPHVRRNIFAFATPTPLPTATPPPPTPTPVPRMGEARFIGPVPTPRAPTPTPIIPPPIPYKITGLFGPPGRLIVALEDGGRLINAREGDVLDGRFVVKRINVESVDFAFVNLPPDITRRLPISR